MSALAPFRIRSFRFQWPADLATSWALEMEVVILGWYVLTQSGSVFLLTVYGAVQFVGTLFAPMLGIMGERLGYRTVLCMMRATYVVLALTVMSLIFLDALTPMIVLVVATFMGLLQLGDLVMRYALIAATVPSSQLLGAMSISRTTMDSARIIGALTGAGLVAAVGMGNAYIGIAACYLLSFVLTLGVSRSTGAAVDAARAAARSPWRDLREAMLYVWATPHLLAAMALAFLVNLTAFPFTTGLLAVVAKEVYGAGQTGLGYLVASFWFGALLGSIALTLHGSGIRPARMMIGASVMWYVLILVFAQVETLAAGIALLALAGLAQSLTLIPLSGILLRNSEPRFHGRLMGLRLLAVYGLPMGLLAAGPLVTAFGFASAATVYCGVGLLFTILIAMRWRGHVWHVQAAANAR